MKLKLSIIPLLLILTACASLGIESPQSFDQRLAYSQGVATSVLSASTASLRAEEITSDDHAHVIAIVDQAKALIDSAKLLSASDLPAANAKLQAATQVLVQIQAYLDSRKRA